MRDPSVDTAASKPPAPDRCSASAHPHEGDRRAEDAADERRYARFDFTFDASLVHLAQVGGTWRRRGVTRPHINQSENYARFFDTFTNTTARPLSIDVAFGGQLGGSTNYSGPYHQSAIAATSSGDTDGGHQRLLGRGVDR